MLLVTLQAWFWEAWTSRRILWQANGPVDLLGNFVAGLCSRPCQAKWWWILRKLCLRNDEFFGVSFPTMEFSTVISKRRVFEPFWRHFVFDGALSLESRQNRDSGCLKGNRIPWRGGDDVVECSWLQGPDPSKAKLLIPSWHPRLKVRVMLQDQVEWKVLKLSERWFFLLGAYDYCVDI